MKNIVFDMLMIKHTHVCKHDGNQPHSLLHTLTAYFMGMLLLSHSNLSQEGLQYYYQSNVTMPFYDHIISKYNFRVCTTFLHQAAAVLSNNESNVQIGDFVTQNSWTNLKKTTQGIKLI